jgi:hypothetical protein
MITIDGTEYNVPIVSLKRKAEFLDKYAERTVDGKLHRELIGMYVNYNIQFGTGADVAEYAALWEKITEPEEFHDVIIPDGDGTHSFEGYFSNISDKMFRYKDPQAFYKELTLNIISRDPTRA